MKNIESKLVSVNVDFVVYDVTGEFSGKVAVQFEKGEPNNEFFFTHFPKEHEDFNWYAFDKEAYFEFFLHHAIRDYRNHFLG